MKERKNAEERQLSRREFLKLSATGAVGVAAGSLLAGCARATPAPAPTPAAPAVIKPRTLRILKWAYWMPGSETWFKDYVQNNWGRNNNVEVIIENVDQPAMWPKISAALEVGSGPDLINLSSNRAHLYANSLLDVGDICEQVGKTGGGFYDHYKAFSQVDGVWKSVPWGTTGGAIAYRKDWLEEIGEAQFPKTWEEYNRVGQIMKERKTPTGQAWTEDNGDTYGTAYALLWSFGAKEALEDGTVAINSKETVAAVEFAVRWFQESLSPEMIGWDGGANNRAYLAEAIWATSNACSVYVQAKTDFPEIAEVTEHHFNPEGPAGSFQMGFPDSWAIPDYVEDPALVKDLLAFMLDETNSALFIERASGYFQGPTKSQENNPIWNEDPKLALFGKPVGMLWPGYPGPPTRQASEVYARNILVNIFIQAFQGMSPQQAVEWAEGEIARVYSEK